jgi:heme-degrading monooxygenase HmoA
MYGRLTTLQISPDAMDQALAQMREQVVPAAQKMDGYRGVTAFGDRSSGKIMAFTLWESEEAMAASEEAANRLRQASAEASSAQVGQVERFEVVFDQRV